MAQMHGIHSSMSSSSPERDISQAPSVVEIPAISLANLSSSSPVSALASSQDYDGPRRANCTCIHDAEAYLEEGHRSASLHAELETARRQACGIHANIDAGLDQQVMEGSPSQHDQGLNCTCMHDAEAYLEEGCCSTSSLSEVETARQQACGISGNADTEQAMEGSSFHHDQGLNEGPHRTNDANSVQPDVDSSSLDADVEKGWGSSRAKQMDVDEECPGECCRVCHLTVDKSPNAGKVIKLGCACKDDLALAHQRCAETWFKIKGNRTCEICGSTARNILRNGDANQSGDMEAIHLGPNRAERCWQNQPLCNTLVVCVLLVLIASWLFRVTLF